jgi:hypothetical protein
VKVQRTSIGLDVHARSVGPKTRRRRQATRTHFHANAASCKEKGSCGQLLADFLNRTRQRRMQARRIPAGEEHWVTAS